MKWFIILLLVIILFLYLAARFFYDRAIYRYGKNIFTKNAEVRDESIDTQLIQKWFMSYYMNEEWIMDSHDGLKLVGTFIRNEHESKGVMLVAHGYVGQSKDLGMFAKMFYDMGYSVLLPDARGHGRSEGDYYGFGWPDRLDIIQWVNEIITECGSDVKIGLFGISMGAATVMMTSGEQLPDNVKVIIEDCGYTSLQDEVSIQMKNLFNLPPFPIIDVTSLYCKYRAGYGFKEASALEQIKKNRLPILMIHGDADKFVPYSMLEPLFEVALEPKFKYVVSGARHGESYFIDPKKYQAVVSDFISEYM